MNIEFISIYIRNPHYIRATKINWNELVLLVFFYLVLSISISIFIGVLAIFLKFENAVNNESVKTLLIKAVLLGPFVEEVLFRLLLKPKLKNLISFSVIVLLLLGYLFAREKYLVFSVVAPIEILVLVLLYKRKNYLFKLQRKFIKYFPYIFYFFMLSFGILHISNFTFTNFNFWIVLISPLLVAPQIVLGSILGFIRMRFGFFYSVLFHIIINGIGVSFLVLKLLK